jgi:hypothetical protein
MGSFSVSDITRAIIMNGVGTTLLYIASFAVLPAQTLTSSPAITIFLFVWLGLFAYQLFHLRRRRQRLALGGSAALPSIASQQRMKAAFSTPAIVLYAVLIAALLAALKYL